MFHLHLCKKLPFKMNTSRNPITHFTSLRNPFSTFTPNSTTDTNDSSFTISYLINSCGLSPESALIAANKLHLKTSDNPDSVLKLFQNHGFTKPQITNLIIKRPPILSANPHKTLHPKLQFLKDVGFSEPDITKLLSSDPSFLTRSLENQIIPSFNLLKTLFHIGENVNITMNRLISTFIFRYNLSQFIKPKVDILLDYGLPKSNIGKLFKRDPWLLTRNNVMFSEMVNVVGEMGFDPLSMKFAHALIMMTSMTKATRDAKMGIFRSFGWSEDEILLAIKSHPFCLTISEEKLEKGLDFFINKLNWEPEHLAKYSNLLGLSFEKRTIPRWTVIQNLISKGLIKKDINMLTVLIVNHSKFVEKFVAKYEGY